MFTVVLLKLKSFLFGNLSTTFIVTLVAMLGVIVLFNADTVLSKMGMETRSTIAAKLAKSEQQLKTVTQVNSELTAKIDTLQKNTATQLNVVQANCREAKEIVTVVTNNSTSLDKVAFKIKNTPRKVKPPSVDSPVEITQPAASDEELVLQMTNNLSPDQLNELSAANITAINSTYTGLFKKV